MDRSQLSDFACTRSFKGNSAAATRCEFSAHAFAPCRKRFSSYWIDAHRTDRSSRLGIATAYHLFSVLSWRKAAEFVESAKVASAPKWAFESTGCHRHDQRRRSAGLLVATRAQSATSPPERDFSTLMPSCERAQGVPAIVWRPTPLGIMSEGQDTVGTKAVFGKKQKALAIAQWSIHIFVNSPGLGTSHNDPPQGRDRNATPPFFCGTGAVCGPDCC